MKKAKINIVMKAILVIIAVFGIQISTVVASTTGDEVISSIPNSPLCPKCSVLIPVIPMEAPFGEIIEFDCPMNLNPVVPDEATFDDNIEVELADNSLAPVVPETADFSFEL